MDDFVKNNNVVSYTEHELTGAVDGTWSVYQVGKSPAIETGMSEHVARDMVRDYAAEGVDCVAINEPDRTAKSSG